MTRRSLDRAALLAAAPASLRARNATPAPAGRPAATRKAHAHVGDRPGARTGPLDATAGVVVTVALRLVNPLNSRQGWRAVSARGRREKAATLAALAGTRLPPGPWDVTITRVSPGRLDDDGATASAKHVRDAVALRLGVDDGDRAAVRFVVTQAKGAASVRVEVRTRRALTCPGCGAVVEMEVR